MSPDDKVRHYNLSLQKGALKWREQNKTIGACMVAKPELLATFGKTQVDYDLAGLSNYNFASDDPLNFVFQRLSYLKVTNPNLSDADKCNRLFEGLPSHLKSYFVRDAPQTVDAFVKRLRDSVRCRTAVNTA